MTSAACVGGMVVSNSRSVRLLINGGYNQPADTDFEVGDIWDIKFSNRTNLHPPHVEDVIVSSKSFVHRVNDLDDFLEQRNLIDWEGHINNLYGGLLHWTNSGSAYIPSDGELPEQSVGFWKSNRALVKSVFNDKTRYSYPNGRDYRHITYVGFQDSINSIPAETIIRVSLSRIFPPDGSTINVPKGYYLQLSGWYI